MCSSIPLRDCDEPEIAGSYGGLARGFWSGLTAPGMEYSSRSLAMLIILMNEQWPENHSLGWPFQRLLIQTVKLPPTLSSITLRMWNYEPSALCISLPHVIKKGRVDNLLNVARMRWNHRMLYACVHTAVSCGKTAAWPSSGLAKCGDHKKNCAFYHHQNVLFI